MSATRRQFIKSAATVAAAVPAAPLLSAETLGCAPAAPAGPLAAGTAELTGRLILQPPPQITFRPVGNNIGHLWFSESGRFEFEGDASASARCFLEHMNGWLTPTLERAGWTPPAGKETPPADVDIYPWPGI